MNLGISNLENATITDPYRMFYSMPMNAIVKVKNATIQAWVIHYRANGWTSSNVIISS